MATVLPVPALGVLAAVCAGVYQRPREDGGEHALQRERAGRGGGVCTCTECEGLAYDCAYERMCACARAGRRATMSRALRRGRRSLTSVTNAQDVLVAGDKHGKHVRIAHSVDCRDQDASKGCLRVELERRDGVHPCGPFPAAKVGEEAGAVDASGCGQACRVPVLCCETAYEFVELLPVGPGNVSVYKSPCLIHVSLPTDFWPKGCLPVKSQLAPTDHTSEKKKQCL
jgi:hypothetical protein